MSDYYAQAVSRKDLRKLAYIIRKEFGYEDKWYIPVDRLLDQMCDLYDELSYQVVSDDEWDDPCAHAYTNISEQTIKIRESIFNNACDGCGRDRMTIAHEIAHYILICDIGIQLHSCRQIGKLKPYNDPEWQAKCLAGEIMIPYYKIKQSKQKISAQQIEGLCGVSFDAANYQLNH